jgi:exopolysaccharide biosynthesis polyprenyl glycosylphosphotransferase
MSPTDMAVRERVRPRAEPPRARRMAAYDVRLRRDLTHRRHAVSLVRRCVRVVTLHLLDALLLAGVTLLLARLERGPEPLQPYVPSMVAIFLLSLNAMAAYDPGHARRDRHRLFTGTLLALMILGCLATFPPLLPLSLRFLLSLGVLGFVSLAVGRKAADQVVRQAYVRGIGLRRALIVGGLDEAGWALRQLRDDRDIDQYVVGYVAAGEHQDPAALGRLSELDVLLDVHDVQEVLVAASLGPDDMNRLTELCFDRGVSVFLVPTNAAAERCWAEPVQAGGCAVLRLHPARLELPSLLIKRGVDVILALVSLVVLSPVIALLAAAIKLDSPGPVFFKARRVGLGGGTFVMWKFRSMRAGAEEQEKELAHLNIYAERGTFKVKDDPRVTRMGRLLRRTSLDELPQLLNVLLGEMSIVGPRPALVGDIDRYEPHHFERLTVVPGITGPWQVGGRNLITDFEQVVRMERDYITRWSLLLDAKIMLRTVKVVIQGEGAY